MYVGLTVQTIEHRWDQHKEDSRKHYIKSEESLHASMREFGHLAFKITIIDRGTTKTDLETKERKWIKSLETMVPKGFNISTGGTSGGSNPKPKEFDGHQFLSVNEANQYAVEKWEISRHAAKWRVRHDKIDVKSPAKPGESLVKTPAYKSWSRIKNNVLNQSSKDYIAGVDLYLPWKQFGEFLKDNGQPPERGMSFIRLNKLKGYFPDNCNWVTKSEASTLNAENMKRLGTLTGRRKTK
jgi:hypothetical protein